MTWMECPACRRRWTGLVADDCPVCSGEGRLPLARGAMEKHGAEVASMAVELGIETRSRNDLGQRLDLGQARRNQTKTVERMRGILLARTGEQSVLGPRKVLTIAQVRDRAAKAAQEYHPEAAEAFDTPVLVWTSDDRPLAHGGIPGFSAGGFVAHLMRVADPQDPLALDGTRGRAQKRWAAARRAEALAGTLPLFDI